MILGGQIKLSLLLCGKLEGFFGTLPTEVGVFLQRDNGPTQTKIGHQAKRNDMI